MTNEETSLRTKKALCQSLKKIMKHKAFSKITVSEIIRDCNINRKTFYYHFEDIYGLLKWIMNEEAIEVVKQFDFLVDYQDAFTFVIRYVEKNSFFLNCLYDSIGRDEMKRFFYQDFIGLVETIIRSYEKQLEITLSDGYRSFFCNFLTEGIAGILINLFQNPKAYSEEDTINYISSMIRTMIPAAIELSAQ